MGRRKYRRCTKIVYVPGAVEYGCAESTVCRGSAGGLSADLFHLAPWNRNARPDTLVVKLRIRMVRSKPQSAASVPVYSEMVAEMFSMRMRS